jgi:hypothetical protein
MLSVIMLNVNMLSVIMLNVNMLSVIMLNINMLNVNMLSVIMLNVNMLNVMAPASSNPHLRTNPNYSTIVLNIYNKTFYSRQ